MRQYHIQRGGKKSTKIKTFKERVRARVGAGDEGATEGKFSLSAFFAEKEKSSEREKTEAAQFDCVGDNVDI